MVNPNIGLEEISFFAGNRFDLVQAGGGNTSVKTNASEMLVKASGINLSEVTQDTGFVPVNYAMIRKFIAGFDRDINNKKQRESIANVAMMESKISDTGKPSIETFLHALLDTYTLHTHPISVNILAAQENWQSLLLDIWPDAVCVSYQTPGIDLALELATEIDIYKSKHDTLPKVVFLQNHGLIVSAESPEKVMEITDAVTDAIECALNIDLSKYRQVTQIQQCLKASTGNSLSIICSDDDVIDQYMKNEAKDIDVWPFCPDTLIYCGIRPVFLENLQDHSAILDYFNQYNEHPKVIVVSNDIYFCAASLKKAKEAQELFKFHLIVIKHAQDNVQRLSLDEVAYLSNWDAEKYRQGV